MNKPILRRNQILTLSQEPRLRWTLTALAKRSMKHLTALPDLAACGVAFISLRVDPDLSKPSGREVFHVAAAMAEFEREPIRERVAAGLRNAWASD